MMGIRYVPCGHGQQAVTIGRNNGWSKHARFDSYGNYIGQSTKQTNISRRKGK